MTNDIVRAGAWVSKSSRQVYRGAQTAQCDLRERVCRLIEEDAVGPGLWTKLEVRESSHLPPQPWQNHMWSIFNQSRTLMDLVELQSMKHQIHS